jgi:hypothetical protein
MNRGVALAVASAGFVHHMLTLADIGSSEMPTTHMSRAAPSGFLSQILPSTDALPHIASTMSKPTGIQEKPTAPKCRTLFRPQTRPADHVSSSPRIESMPDADQQSSPALGVTPDLEDIPGLADSQDTATSGEYGSDTEEEDNTELENYYLNKPKEYERRVETLFGDSLRVWKSKDGTWYTYFEGEVIDGQAMLPARYRQPSYKETLSVDRHSFSEVHTAVEQSTAVKPSKAVEHTAYKQSTTGSQSDMFKQSVSFEQPVTDQQQRRGIDTPSDVVMGGTDASQRADDLDTDEYPPTAPPSPHSAVAHLAHGGSPASGLLSPPPSQVSTSSPRRVTSGSFGTFEGSPGRVDDRVDMLHTSGAAAT